MRSLLFALVLLLPLAACGTFTGSGTPGSDYDLTLRYHDGMLAARIQFTAPPVQPCDAIGCASGEAHWEARDLDPDFPLDEASGVLYAEETGSGFILSLTPQVSDQNVTIEIERAGGTLVVGAWQYATIAGPVLSGSVEGRVE